MKTKTIFYQRIKFVIFFVFFVLLTNLAQAGDRPGFILLAPDRGFMGNNEIKKVYEDFQNKMSAYPCQLVFASEKALPTYLREAVQYLQTEGATKIVIIPLFFSEMNTDIERARRLFGVSKENTSNNGYDDAIKVQQPVEFAPTLAHSYLTAQILEDRARELSESPAKERLVVLGAGVSNNKEAESLETDLQELSQQVRKRLGFIEAHTFVLYDREAEGGQTQRTETFDEIKRISSLEGKTLLVPFFIDMKLTPMMSMENMLGRYSLRDIAVKYNGKSILPHANVARWAVKTARRYIPVNKENIGIVFMNHGSFYYYNEKMRKVARPLADEYKLEFAMSMASPLLIQQAVNRLEERGATHIIVLRVFSLARSFKEKTEYMLGLRDTLTMRRGSLPNRVRSSAVLYTTGGVEDDPLFAEVLLERAQAISKNPKKEVVILVAHGLGSDDGDTQWRELLRSLASQMQSRAKNKFSAMKVATWREDWPDKREKALKEIKAMIRKAHQSGRQPLVVAARLEGNDPGDEFLKGLDFAYNGDGFSGHANFTKWSIEKIEEAVLKIQADRLASE